MDGVIVDSNHIHYENWNSVFVKQFGVELPKDDFGRQLGRSGKHFTEYFIKKYNLNASAEDLKPLILARFDELHADIKLKPSVIEVLKDLKKDHKIALATGAGKDWAISLMKKLGTIDYFDFIIGGDEIAEAKPNPEIFLKAAEGLGLRPQECIVVEDAELGIMAARSAGIKVISIPDNFTIEQDHSLADGHLTALKELRHFVEKLN